MKKTHIALSAFILISSIAHSSENDVATPISGLKVFNYNISLTKGGLNLIDSSFTALQGTMGGNQI
ncbi:hypothetical protein TUMSATVNIG1_60580 (plasmid) [Vibrio nigripulchritudo]|uniref:hypothetical protein n=1 Tax=Vibrio nigripulchritudo TaxID=28173 RepID=UPI00190DEEC7|nr:hypothetical protein [Vibrio nigripulchritudo]BCL74073.1 hypothetical protein VNTUMSATTG_60100 [Vibrio nigripulchritudo]BDU35449.1 hypothetical protein TUMSATVNIG1_60580 [Vibrio nigripulchritudo]